jgi:hypothetical protein
MTHSTLEAAVGTAAFLFWFMAVSAVSQTYPPAYPRPNATKIIDNARVNVWDVYWIKNQPTPLHTHVIDQFSITLRGGLLRVSPAGGPWGEVHMSKVGSVNFVPARTTHMEEGMSDVPQHKIMLEVKPSPPRPDAHGAPPAQGAIKVFENDRLSAWDLVWNPGGKVARPAEDFDTVTVFLHGGTIRATGDGAAKSVIRKSGAAVYEPRGTPDHVEQAVSGAPRAIIVELK